MNQFLILQINVSLALIVSLWPLKAIAILTLPTLMRIEENKALESLPGAKAATLVPGVCESACMYSCAMDTSCYAYTFDGNNGTCNKWNHSLIQLVIVPKAKSYIRGSAFLNRNILKHSHRFIRWLELPKKNLVLVINKNLYCYLSNHPFRHFSLPLTNK